MSQCRGSPSYQQPPEVFYKKGVPKNFAIFTRKHLCQSLFLSCNFIKKETLAQGFSCEFCKIFKNTFFYRATLVVVSGKIRTKHLKLEKFQFQLFLTTLDIMGIITENTSGRILLFCNSCWLYTLQLYIASSFQVARHY